MDVDAKLKEILRLAEKKPCTGFDAFCIANLAREVQEELKTYNEDMTRVSKRLLDLDKKHLELKQLGDIGPRPPPHPWRDPVHQEGEEWYFWDETWAGRLGPYGTEEEARKAIQKYADDLQNIHASGLLREGEVE